MYVYVLYDDPTPSYSWQIAYKNFWLLGNYQQTYMSPDLLVLLVRPVLSDVRVAEVPYFVQHRLHECRSELSGVVGPLLPLVVNDVLARAGIVVETRQRVEKHATTFHVPVNSEIRWMT